MKRAKKERITNTYKRVCVYSLYIAKEKMIVRINFTLYIFGVVKWVINED